MCRSFDRNVTFVHYVLHREKEICLLLSFSWQIALICAARKERLIFVATNLFQFQTKRNKKKLKNKFTKNVKIICE